MCTPGELVPDVLPRRVNLGVDLGVFWVCSGGVLGVFRGCSGGVLGVFRTCSGSVPGVCRKCSGGFPEGEYHQKRPILECRKVSRRGIRAWYQVSRGQIGFRRDPITARKQGRSKASSNVPKHCRRRSPHPGTKGNTRKHTREHYRAGAGHRTA